MNGGPSKPKQDTRSPVEILRIVLAAIAALAAVTLLVLNLMSFLDTVNYYLAMGYPSGEVYKQLVPSQLLPGIFEPVAIYGGMALLLIYVGRINQKVSDCQAMLTPADFDGVVEASVKEPELIEKTTAEPGNTTEDNRPAD
ncbi:MAG: hypothetical protein ACM3UW_00775 [Bacillota bacterium]